MSSPASINIKSFPLASDPAKYTVRTITLEDLKDALHLGWKISKPFPRTQFCWR